MAVMTIHFPFISLTSMSVPGGIQTFTYVNEVRMDALSKD